MEVTYNSQILITFLIRWLKLWFQIFAFLIFYPTKIKIKIYIQLIYLTWIHNLDLHRRILRQTCSIKWDGWMVRFPMNAADMKTRHNHQDCTSLLEPSVTIQPTFILRYEFMKIKQVHTNKLYRTASKFYSAKNIFHQVGNSNILIIFYI